MTTTTTVTEVFEDYLEYIQKETDVKEALRLKIRELDQVSREIVATLQKIHQVGNANELPMICSQISTLFEEKVATKYHELSELVPSDQYYRYSNMWQFTTQKLVFCAVLTRYLEDESLMDKEAVAKVLGLDQNSFHLDLEDYLGGLIQMSNELARFTVNSVTRGDYDRPLRISNFLNQLNAGFRLLNLKNDNLRKKFDSLKYDMKKVEEVVYDLSIRGLTSKTTVEESIK